MQRGNFNAAMLHDLLRQSLGMPPSFTERQAAENEAAKVASQEAARNRQRLDDLVRQLYSREAAPLVLDAINRDPSTASSYVGNSTRDQKDRADLENMLDTLMGRAPPSAMPTNRATRQELDSLLGRPPYDPNAPIIPTAAGQVGPNAGDYLGATQHIAGKLGKGDGFSGAVGRDADTAMLALRAGTGDVGAAIELIADLATAIPRAVERAMTNVPQAVKEGLTSQRAGQVFGTAGHAGQEFGKAVGEVPGFGMLGKFLEMHGKFLSFPGDALEGLREFSAHLHETNMQFKEFSGGMAATSAMQSVRDIFLSQERGERRASTANFLAEQKHKVEQSVAPFEDLMANLQNVLTGSFNAGLSAVINAVMPTTVGDLNQYLADLVGGGDPGQLKGWMDKAAKGPDYSQYGKPQRFVPHMTKP